MNNGSVMIVGLFLLVGALLATLARADPVWPGEDRFLVVPGASAVDLTLRGIPAAGLPPALRVELARYDWGTPDGMAPAEFRAGMLDLDHDGSAEYFIRQPAGSGSGGSCYIVLSRVGGEWRRILWFQGVLQVFPATAGWPRLIYLTHGGGGIWARTYAEFRNGRYEDTVIERYERGTITRTPAGRS